jgi:hypothetical protein
MIQAPAREDSEQEDRLLKKTQMPGGEREAYFRYAATSA